MSSGNEIEHTGIIEAIDDDGIKVKFTSVSACAACHAKGVCSASDMKEKEVTVPGSNGNFHKGDPVFVTLKASMGTKAVLIGYIYPFFLLLTVLLILSGTGLTELRAGLLSLGTLIPYYFILFLLRNKLERTFAFTIRKSVVL